MKKFSILILLAGILVGNTVQASPIFVAAAVQGMQTGRGYSLPHHPHEEDAIIAEAVVRITDGICDGVVGVCKGVKKAGILTFNAGKKVSNRIRKEYRERSASAPAELESGSAQRAEK